MPGPRCARRRPILVGIPAGRRTQNKLMLMMAISIARSAISAGSVLRGGSDRPCLAVLRWIHSRRIRLGGHGEVAEWLKAPHSKCGIRVTVSGVRIPPSPPVCSRPTFSTGLASHRNSPLMRASASKPPHCEVPPRREIRSLRCVCLQTSRLRGFSTELLSG
jgi:hypothetical protein